MNDGCVDADELSFNATTTTPYFLGFPSSRAQRNNPFHEQAPETEEDGKNRAPKKTNE